MEQMLKNYLKLQEVLWDRQGLVNVTLALHASQSGERGRRL